MIRKIKTFFGDLLYGEKFYTNEEEFRLALMGDLAANPVCNTNTITVTKPDNVKFFENAIPPYGRFYNTRLKGKGVNNVVVPVPLYNYLKNGGDMRRFTSINAIFSMGMLHGKKARLVFSDDYYIGEGR